MDLREYLFRNRITVTQMARKLGYSRSHFNMVVLGEKPMSKKLADLLENETWGRLKARELLKPPKKSYS